jgi:hypothetical protein
MNPEGEMQDMEFYDELQAEFPEMFDEHNLEEFAETPIEAQEVPVEVVEVQPENVEMQPEAVPEPVEMPIEVEESYDDEPIEGVREHNAVRPISKKVGLYREVGIDLDTEQGKEDLDAYWDYVLIHGVNRGNEVLNEIPVKEGTDRYPMPEPHDAISHPFGSGDFEKLKEPFNMEHHRFREVLGRCKDLAITFSSLSHEEGRENMQKKYNEIIEPLVEKKRAMLDGYSKYQQFFNKSKLFDEVLPGLSRKIAKIKGVWEQYSNWK